MKQIWFSGLLAMTVVSLTGLANAGYAVYVNVSIDSTNKIYSSAVVDGSYYAMCCGAMHSGRVYNKLNGVGGWVYGPGVPPQNYISVTNNQSVQGAEGGVYEDDTTEAVNCTVGGLVFVANINKVFRIAATYWGPPVVKNGDLCYWSSNACSAGTTPTCTATFGLTFAPACPNYVKLDFLVVDGVCIGHGFIHAETGPGPCS